MASEEVYSTLGAVFIAVIVSTLIYGITCLQVYLYYTEHFAGDKTPLRLFVAFLMILDTLHEILVAHSLYFYDIINFGNVSAVHKPEWSTLIESAVHEATALCVQFFFAYRIYCLSKRVNWWMPAVVISLSLGGLGSSIAFVIRGFQVDTLHDATRNGWLARPLAFSIACDATISLSMVYYLLQRRTEFPRTNMVVKTLIRYTLNTGLLNCMFASATIATFFARPNGMIHLIFFYIHVRLYVCAFLSTLNMRSSLRAKMGRRDPHTASPLSLLHHRTPSEFTTGTDSTVTSPSAAQRGFEKAQLEFPSRTLDIGPAVHVSVDTITTKD